ncbi:MAG: tetraacyldisaccharide 4'-kinase [Desulfovibrio sp.]|nr:tetraacyldisaccharide 4'-kinase [Desulfovibrio sp.]MBI4959394.1 tetraacyldisaccharide 4'-kinase [Desulfovibrio sp.]
MQDIFVWQHRFRHLLAPPAALTSLAMRLRAALYARHVLPSWTPPVPAVCVGGVNSLARGKVLVTAWLMGWAEARGLHPALLAGPRDASPSDMPFLVTADTPAAQCGTDAALLARYRPGATIMADDKPGRAGKSVSKAHQPGIFILHDFSSALSIGRNAEIQLLNAHDLDKGWNRPFPAGSWREGKHALKRANAFILHIWPDELPLRKTLAERRLAHLGKPIFTVHPRIWRLRQATGETATDLGGEPYLLVTAESNQDVAAKAAQAFIGLPPRLRIVFPDSHRFTNQDQDQIAADAARIRAPHVLATPEAALRLASVPGRTLWTYDPDVVLGACLVTGQNFLPWWETCWTELSVR